MTPTCYYLAWARREEARSDPKHPEHGCSECWCGRVVRIGKTCNHGKPTAALKAASPPPVTASGTE